MKKIYTVIVRDTAWDEYSTVSFESFSSACTYIINEIANLRRSKMCKDERDTIRDLIKEYYFFKENKLAFYLEEANLVLKKSRKTLDK